MNINVMYAADDGYAEIAGVSIESFLDNNRDFENITIFFIEDGISEENKNKLRKTVEKYGRKIVFITKLNIREFIGTDLHTLRWSDSAYSRLYLDEFFRDHPEIHKLLYLDCDTLILDSLCELWKEDITDYLGAAVLECMSNMHKKIIGAKSTDNYINTGMILFNVDKWKEEKISKVCTEFIKKYKGKTEYVDQGVINGTVVNRFKIVNPRYNLTALSWDFTYEEMQVYRKPDHGYSKEQWEDAVDNPAIIHFTTSFLSIRPWYENSNTPYSRMWDMYHELGEWKGFPKRGNQTNKEHRLCFMRIIPRRILISVCGILHAYMKPIVFKIYGR